LSSILLDLRYGFRNLVKNPSFSLVALTALALGIGANTAVFSVIDAVLLRPMPYADSDRLVVITATEPGNRATSRDAVTAGDVMDIREQSQVFEEVAASRGQDFSLIIGDQPETATGTVCNAGLFSMSGIRPLLGRTLLPSDEGATAERAVVLSAGYWKSRFGADPNVIGERILMESAPAVIVGVMPDSFRLPSTNSLLWAAPRYVVPEHVLRPAENPLSNRGSQYLRAWGKIKPGFSVADAQAELDVIAARIREAHPDVSGTMHLRATSVHEFIFGNLRPMLWVLLGAVTFVLLAACANIANLLLARATARQREIAVRAAIGASRARIAQQMLTESLLLAVIGAFFGVLFATWAIPAVMALSPDAVRQAGAVHIDIRVLFYTIGASFLAALIFGSFPLLQTFRSDLREALQSGSHGGTATRGHGRVRGVLVASEIALSLVLLVAAGLMVNGFYHLTRIDPGFRPENLVDTRIALPQGKYPNHITQSQFYERALEQFKNIPGVESVGGSSRPPMTGGNSARTVSLPGQDSNLAFDTDMRTATPGYFRTIGQRFLAGRDIADTDTLNTPHVGVVNQRMAEMAWPGEDPIGKTFIVNDATTEPYQVIGVVNNVRFNGLDDDIRPEMYFSYRQV
jgi:putative ABC transport system permease protein